jgi:hypothetical protein
MLAKLLKYLLSTAAYALIFAAVILLLFALNRIPLRNGDLPLYFIGGFFGKLAYDFILKAVRTNKKRG